MFTEIAATRVERRAEVHGVMLDAVKTCGGYEDISSIERDVSCTYLRMKSLF